MVKMAQLEPLASRWGMLEGSCLMVEGADMFQKDCSKVFVVS